MRKTRQYALIVSVDIDNPDVDHDALLHILQDDFNTFAESPDIEAVSLRSLDAIGNQILSLTTHGEYVHSSEVIEYE